MRIEQRGKITSLALLATLLLVQEDLRLQVYNAKSSSGLLLVHFLPSLGIALTQVQDLALGCVEK